MDALREWIQSDLDVIIAGTWMLCGNGWSLIWTLSWSAHGCSAGMDGAGAWKGAHIILGLTAPLGGQDASNVGWLVAAAANLLTPNTRPLLASPCLFFL